MAEQIENKVKPNYQIDLDHLLNVVNASGKRPKLLLHSCCGPCSSYCLSYLHDFFDITVFYYNPNIYPEEEYIHRLNEQKRLISLLNQDLQTDIRFLEGDYDYAVFLNEVKGLEEEPEGGKRCRTCFELRLSEAQRVAKKGAFDYFGTTLTVSPHKNALVINEVGASISDAYASAVHPLWMFSDFKKRNGYQTSIVLSRKYDLYRQDYCGCEFSL